MGSRNTNLLQQVTGDQLTQLLMDMRQRYVRICELADHPWTVGFSQRYHKIIMSAEHAAQHTLVRYSSVFYNRAHILPYSSILVFTRILFDSIRHFQMTKS